MKKPNGKSKHHGGIADGKCVFSVRLHTAVRDRLAKQAEREDRSMAYLVAVFVQHGLDERARIKAAD
jgi:hypothetical protein